MNTRLLLVAAVVVLSSSRAHAIPRDSCPPGTEWSLSAGSCMKKKPAPKLSAQEKFVRANDDIEGRGKSPDPRRGVALLEEACGRDSHPESCNLLGFLYTRGRVVAKDDKKAMDYYVKSCKLKDVQGCFYIGDLAYRIGTYPAARDAFQKTCDMGGGVACTRGAELLEDGTGGAKEPAKALAMYKRSMEILAPLCPGDGPACFIVGFLHENAKATPKDPTKAITAYRAGCTAGSGNACMSLATGLDKGLGGKVDTEGANQAYDKACNDFDNSEACQKISERLGMAKKDLDRAFKMAKRGCDLDPKYCGTAAEFYRLGFGMAAADQVTATKYYKQACENGELGWCQRYGERAHDGLGMAADFDGSQAVLERACKGGYGESCDVAAGYVQEVGKDYARAATLANLGCEGKYATSCWRAGSLAEAGRGGPASPEKALAYFQKGCGLNSPASCDSLGDAYREGKGTTKDPQKAIEAYKKGCEGNEDKMSAPSCKSLGTMEYFGEAGPKNLKAALTALSRACEYGEAGTCDYLVSLNAEAGGKRDEIAKPMLTSCKAKHEEACVAYGNMLSSSESETDRRAAYEAFEASCGRKHDPACLRQADQLAFGWGVAKNADKAEQLYRPRCDGGSPQACFGLGQIQETAGKHDEAQRLYLRACEGDFANACSQIGFRYYTAKGVRWDIAAAVKYFNKACELGSLQGCSNSAYVYRWGTGAPIDHKKAFELYDKSCKPTFTSPCDGLGHYLATGEGGTKVDKKRAELVYRSACDGGEESTPEACLGLAELLDTQTPSSPAEIARLRTMAFNRATELAKDNPSHQYLLGTFYSSGMATMKDPAQALVWYTKACEGFDPLGCIAAGKALRATGKSADGERARVYLERACAAGVNEGCTLGSSKAKGPTAVHGGQGCGGSEVAPGGQLGLALMIFGLVMRRRYR
ncbi:MAG: Sel1 protein [Deltaproteobacteria bacterium]|nr:Sel1 protein [Deltaproteobacteria bacterium]